MDMPPDQQENMNRLLRFIDLLNKEYDARIDHERAGYCSLFWSHFFHGKDFYRIRLSRMEPDVDKDVSGNPGAYDGTYSTSDQVVALPRGVDVHAWVEKVRDLQPYWWDTMRALSYRHTWMMEPATKSYGAFQKPDDEVVIEKLN